MFHPSRSIITNEQKLVPVPLNKVSLSVCSPVLLTRNETHGTASPVTSLASITPSGPSTSMSKSRQFPSPVPNQRYWSPSFRVMSIVAVSLGASDAANRQLLSLANPYGPIASTAFAWPIRRADMTVRRAKSTMLSSGSSSACSRPAGANSRARSAKHATERRVRGGQHGKSGEENFVSQLGLLQKAGKTEQRSGTSRCPQNRTRNSSGAFNEEYAQLGRILPQAAEKFFEAYEAVGASRIGGANGARPSPRRYAKGARTGLTTHT